MASRLDLENGDVIRLTSLRNNFAGPMNEKGKQVGLLSVSYSAPKGKVFVAVLLGIENKDGTSPLDLEAAMGRLGWVRADEEA